MNIQMKALLLIFVSTLTLFAQWAPNARQNRQSEELLLRIHSRYDMDLPNAFYMKPYSMMSVGTYLGSAIESGKLTPFELSDALLIKQWNDGSKTLFSRHGDRGGININLSLIGDLSLAPKDSLVIHGKGTLNPRINGHIGNLSFYSDMMIHTEIATDTLWPMSSYEPYDGTPYNLFNRDDSASVRSSDIFRAGVTWKLGKTAFDFAVDHLQSGPAIYNPLTLNSTKHPITYLRTTMDFKWFTYSHTAGMLRNFRDGKKFLYHHRLQFPLFKNRLIFGFNEAIVYGSTLDSTSMSEINNDPLQEKYNDVERSIEPVYLIPFVPFAFAEHFSGDKDNALMSIDLMLKMIPNTHIYSEFLIDDMSNPLTLFSDDFGNKWAITVGGLWFNELFNRDFTASLEYTRVEPWTYTHFRGASHNYTNFGTSMGAELGPNSAQINLGVKLQLTNKQSLAIRFQNSRYDRTYRGGQIFDVMIDKNSALELDLTADIKTKEFLVDPESESVGTLEWTLLPYRLYEMKTSVSLHDRSFDESPFVSLGLWGSFNF